MKKGIMKDRIIRALFDILIGACLMLIIVLTMNSMRDSNIDTVEYYKPDGSVIRFENVTDVYVWKTTDVVDFNYNGQRVRISDNYVIYTKKNSR